MVYSIFTKHIVAHSFWIWHFFLESIKTFRKCYNGRQNGCSNDQVKKRTCAMKSLNLWDIKATLFCCMCVCVRCTREFATVCVCDFLVIVAVLLPKSSIHFTEIILFFWRTTTLYSSVQWERKKTTNNVCWFDIHSNSQLEIFDPILYTPPVFVVKEATFKAGFYL